MRRMKRSNDDFINQFTVVTAPASDMRFAMLKRRGRLEKPPGYIRSVFSGDADDSKSASPHWRRNRNNCIVGRNDLMQAFAHQLSICLLLAPRCTFSAGSPLQYFLMHHC